MRTTPTTGMGRRPRSRWVPITVLGILVTVSLLAGLASASHTQSGGSPPSASFSLPATEVLTGQTVTLTDTSSDPDQDLAAWAWALGDGASAQGPTVSHAYADDGAYTIALTVSDQAGHQDTATRSVTVLNRAPTAAFETPNATVGTAEPVGFDDASTDPDGSIVDRTWSFGDGASATGNHPNHTYRSPGTYQVTLTVVDDDGASDATNRTVTVEDRAPSVTLAADPPVPAWHEPTRLTTHPSDVHGSIAAIDWTLGDGTTAQGAQVVHAFEHPGSYTVIVQVTDEAGRQAEVSLRIDVSTAPEGSPGQDAVIQPLVDAAQPGDVVELPPGAYQERVVVDKPLVLVGARGTTIDGGAGPAMWIAGGTVELRDLGLASEGVPLAVHGAERVALWNVARSAPQPIAATETSWLVLVDPVGVAHEEPTLMGSRVVHAHPVQLRVVDVDGEPVEGERASVRDGGRTVLEATSDAEGRLGTVPVVHRWTGPTGGGSNETLGFVEGAEAGIPIDPHAGSMVLTAAVDASPVDALTIVLAATIMALFALGLAWRFHEGFRRWLWVFIAPLYTRLKRSELLDHETREAIHEHLEENPGSHLRGIKRALDLHHGTLLHHLKMLEDQELIRSVKDGMYRRFYVIGQAPEATGRPSTRELVFELVEQEPGITNARIADALDTEPDRTHYHVRQLVEEGRVRRERDGREVHLFPASDAAASE